jgi:hypothetical protein
MGLLAGVAVAAARGSAGPRPRAPNHVAFVAGLLALLVVYSVLRYLTPEQPGLLVETLRFAGYAALGVGAARLFGSEENSDLKQDTA